MIKIKAGCKDCHMTDYRCLDFHHDGDGKKLSTVSALLSRRSSIERINKEIELCIVLCSNCHRQRHLVKNEEFYKELEEKSFTDYNYSIKNYNLDEIAYTESIVK